MIGPWTLREASLGQRQFPDALAGRWQKSHCTTPAQSAGNPGSPIPPGAASLSTM